MKTVCWESQVLFIYIYIFLRTSVPHFEKSTIFAKRAFVINNSAQLKTMKLKALTECLIVQFHDTT